VKRKRESIRPPDAPPLGTKYRDWRDFTDRVARPWIENDSQDAKIDAWYSVLMTEADPWYLACALVIADNHIRRLEGENGDA